MEGHIDYLQSEYAKNKVIEEYNGVSRWHRTEESFKFKDHIYDMAEDIVKLTTDLEYPQGLLAYKDKLVEMLDVIKEFVETTERSKRVDKFTSELFETLGRILKP